MFKMLSVMVLSGILAAFTPAGEPAGIGENVKELSGYRLRDKSISLNDYNLWVIANEETFDKAFIADSNAVTRPAFEKELVLAAKVETYANSYKVKFKTAIVKDESLNVYFSIQRDKHPQVEAGKVAVTVFPKSTTIRKVNFYHDTKLVRSVPVVNVY
jgi:hypothetical protein